MSALRLARLTALLRRPGLTRSFMLAGAVAISAFSVGMALLLSAFIESRLLQRDAELSRDFVQSVLDTQGVAGVFRGSGTGSDDRSFTEFLSHLASLPDVLRANVYTPDRRVLWSSQPELTGRQFTDNEELDEALAGRTVAHFDTDAADKSEHVRLGGGAKSFVENYLPLRDRSDGSLLGVVELYRRPVALTEALQSGHRRIWLGAAVGGLALALSLLWFVRRIERSLHDQQARLVDSEALAMVGELSGAVAHSIRNPLGSIRSAADLQRELGPSLAMDPEDVIRQVDRIEHLVRTLLTCAHDPLERSGHCDAARVLGATRDHVAPELAAQGKTFVCDWPADLGEVPLDEILLAQSLASVLTNAAEASTQGQTVWLRAEKAGGGIRIHIEDEGAGLGDGDGARAMQPFVTTKPRGLGLGLPLARRAAERAGGQLSLQARQPRGTRVTMTLPAHPA